MPEVLTICLNGWSVALALASCGGRYEDLFCREDILGLRDDVGCTIAYRLADKGLLDERAITKKVLSMDNEYGHKVAMRLASMYALPEKFKSDMEVLKLNHGSRMVAHILASHGDISDEILTEKILFLQTPDGWSVAHEAAYYFSLPRQFLIKKILRINYKPRGWKVAHVLAVTNRLPEEAQAPDILLLRDKKGRSVAHALASCGGQRPVKHAPDGKIEQMLLKEMHAIEDNDGWTVLEEYFNHGGPVNEDDIIREKNFFSDILFGNLGNRIRKSFVNKYRIPRELHDFRHFAENVRLSKKGTPSSIEAAAAVPLSMRDWYVYRIGDFFRLWNYVYGITDSSTKREKTVLPGWNDSIWTMDFLLVHVQKKLHSGQERKERLPHELSIIEYLAQYPGFLDAFPTNCITNKILSCELAEQSRRRYMSERRWEVYTMKDVFVKAEKYPENESMAALWFTEIMGDYTAPAKQFFRNNYGDRADAVLQELRIKHTRKQIDNVTSGAIFFF